MQILTGDNDEKKSAAQHRIINMPGACCNPGTLLFIS
jgi:hypothetical protein